MISDEEIIKKFHITKDGYAIEEIFERYKTAVKSKARRFYLIHGDVEDLVQEGMLGLYNAISTYNPDSGTSFKTYANLCIERKIISAFRKYNRQKHLPLNTAVDIEKNAEEVGKLSFVNPEDIVMDNCDAATLYEKISGILSPFEKRAAALYLDGFDYLTIAEKLGKTPKSVDNALQRVKDKLADYFSADGGHPPAENSLPGGKVKEVEND